jgi:hypothetical protein
MAGEALIRTRIETGAEFETPKKTGILLKIPVKSEAPVSNMILDFFKNTANILNGAPDGDYTRLALAASQNAGIGVKIKQPPEVLNQMAAANFGMALEGIKKGK